MDAQGWAVYCCGLMLSVDVAVVEFGCDGVEHVFEYLYVRSAVSLLSSTPCRDAFLMLWEEEGWVGGRWGFLGVARWRLSMTYCALYMGMERAVVAVEEEQVKASLPRLLLGPLALGQDLARLQEPLL